MEIDVILNELERMNTEIHSYSELIDQISSSFNITCQELMSEIESELDEEINIAIEESKKLSEKVFLDIKRHENFILNAFNAYKEVDKEVFYNLQNIKGLVLNDRRTPVIFTYKPTVVIPKVPNIVIDILPPIFPSTKPVTPHRRGNNGTTPIIPGVVEKIATLFVPAREFMGAFIILAPGAVISAVSDIIPMIFGGFTGVETKDDLDNEESEGTYAYNGSFEKLINEVGDAQRFSYNLIRAWLAAEIINYIIQEYTFISEIIKYKTLGPAPGESVEEYSEEKTDTEEAGKSEKAVNIGEEVDEREDSRTGIFTASSKTEHTEDGNRGSYDHKGINASNIGTAFGGVSATYGMESQFFNSQNEDREKNVDRWNSKKDEDTAYSTNINAEGETPNNTSDQGNTYENRSVDETFDNKKDFTSSSVGSGAVGIGGYIPSVNEGNGFVSETRDSDIIEGDINVSEGFFSATDDMAKKYLGRTKSDTSVAFGSTADKSSVIYRNIVAAGDESNIANGTIPAGAIGTGLASAAGIGTLGSLLFKNLGSGEVEDAIKCVAGAMKYMNLFDMVGNAERCSISWLGETVNILAQ